MTEHHRTLLDDLDRTSVGEAPVGQLLSGGQAAKRRARRGLVAATAAVTVLVVGGGAIALQGITDGGGNRSSGDRVVADSAARDLTVQVEIGVPKLLATQLDGQGGEVAFWNPKNQTLAFVPDTGYSSGCPPLGSAEVTQSGTVEVTLRGNPANNFCRTDSTPVTVTINGLTTTPSQLTVITGGDSTTIPVNSALAGVTTDGDSETNEGTVVAGGVTVVVSEPANGGLDARGGGRLEVVGGCLGASGSVIVWPYGTTVVEDKPLTVDIPTYGTFALGDTVWIGGGYILEHSSDDVEPGDYPVGGVTVPAECAKHDIFVAN